MVYFLEKGISIVKSHSTVALFYDVFLDSHDVCELLLPVFDALNVSNAVQIKAREACPGVVGKIHIFEDFLLHNFGFLGNVPALV